MGFGGEVLWTAVARNLVLADGRPVVVAATPRLTDVLSGRLYDASQSFRHREVFRGNPHLRFPPARRKSAAARLVDAAWRAALRVTGTRRWYERIVFRVTERACRRAPYRLVHIDMAIHSYGRVGRGRRMRWRSGGHIVDTMTAPFGVPVRTRSGDVHVSTATHARVRRLLAAHGLSRFVAVEPATNSEWFGTLRAWPFDRWQALVDRLREQRPDIPVVQVGTKDSRRLDGVVDVCGQTTFMEAAAVLSHAVLFIGTEGGLMHAANAVEAASLILWGGVTLPEFAGYPDRQRVVCHYVPCAPCGNLGWCRNGHICMERITVDDVAAVAAEAIASLSTRHTTAVGA